MNKESFSTYQNLIKDVKNFLKEEDFFYSKETPKSFLKVSLAKTPSILKEEIKVTSTLIKKEEIKKEEPKISKNMDVAKVLPSKNKEELLEDSFDDLFLMMKRFGLEKAYTSDLPEDTKAMHNKNLWKFQTLSYPLAIITFKSDALETTFLKNLTKAIDLYLVPTKLIDGGFLEKEEEWKNFFSSSGLKWVLVSSQSKKISYFQSHLKCEGQRFFIDNIEVFFIDIISSYFSNPLKKFELWSFLKEKLSEA